MSSVLDLPQDERPDQVQGYKRPRKSVSAKEFLKMDQKDESLRKWKAQVLKDLEPKFPNDPRSMIVESLIIVVQGGKTFDLNPNDRKAQASKVHILKEGATFNMVLKFYVQREVVSSLKYMQFISRFGIRMEKSTQVIGSYGPSKDVMTYTFPEDNVPNGALVRGAYTAKARIVDDDDNIHLEMDWAFEIKGDWQ